MTHTIQVSDAGDEAVRAAIVGPLVAYNVQKTGTSDVRPLAIVIRDVAGEVIGGLWGRTGFGWLYVELLFVPESLRAQGIGTDLMRRAETEAASRGCDNAWLDTFEFQARPFYEHLGYRCFGELADYPPGFSRYFMTRRLQPAVGNPSSGA